MDTEAAVLQGCEKSRKYSKTNHIEVPAETQIIDIFIFSLESQQPPARALQMREVIMTPSRLPPVRRPNYLDIDCSYRSCIVELLNACRRQVECHLHRFQSRFVYNA